MLQMQSKLKETFSRFHGAKKFLVHYSFWVNSFIAPSLSMLQSKPNDNLLCAIQIVLVGLLLVSLLDASLLSLPFLLAACVGALVPVRYVIYGILAFRLSIPASHTSPSNQARYPCNYIACSTSLHNMYITSK